jgi:transglutaminase-like putative cysteine protease
MTNRTRGTDGSLLASLPWTLAALVVALAPHMPFLPIWITGAFLGCAAWRYIIEKRRRTLPASWLRAVLALFCFLGVLFTYSSISGVGPGSALLAIMAALKLLETRKRRDQFVLLFLSIFLVMSSLLREQHLWSLPYMVVSMLVIMSAWLRMSAGESQSPRRSIATAGRLLMYAAPLAITMWVFFPRIATPFWTIPIDTSRATSGISDTMSPGDISSLSMSNAVAFRVSFDDEIPEPRDRYWRGLVLTRFNGRTWTGRDPTISPRALDQIEVSGNAIEYEVTLEPTHQQWVFALDVPTQWSLSETLMGPDQQLARNTPLEQRVAYRVTSFTNYKIGADLSNLYRSWYSSLPEGSNPRTAELARQMLNDAGSDREYVEAVLQKLNREEYFYTLDPPPLGSNPVDQFLFDTKRGFCEHYASAFSVLMRSVGIPARIVLGYQGGEINPIGGHLIVRQSDAHAWTEVWLDGLGWYRVDPTAAVAPERIDIGASDAAFEAYGRAWGLTAPSRLLHRAKLALDAVDAKWNELILGYGPDTQNSFMKWLGMNNPTWRKMMLTLIVLVVGLVMLVSVVLMLRYRPPSKDDAARLYRQFVSKTGLEPHTGETASVFAGRVADTGRFPEQTVDEITEAYLDARYGQNDETAFERLKAAVRAIA